MDMFRIHDTVARLGGVNLQNTVSVLNSLYVVSKELEREGEPGFSEFRNTLERLLVTSSLDDCGRVQGLRVNPSDRNVRDCGHLTGKVLHYFAQDVMRIRRESGVELITPIANELLESYYVERTA